MYERKRMADEEELKQSIKRYKDNATWLQELMSADLPSEKIAERSFTLPLPSLHVTSTLRES